MVAVGAGLMSRFCRQLLQLASLFTSLPPPPPTLAPVSHWTTIAGLLAATVNLGVGLVFVTLLRCGELWWTRGLSPLHLLRRPPNAPPAPRLLSLYMVAPGVCGTIIVSTTIVLIDRLG